MIKCKKKYVAYTHVNGNLHSKNSKNHEKVILPCPLVNVLSETLYNGLAARGKVKLCTKFEVTSFTGFGDIVDGLLNFTGVM